MCVNVMRYAMCKIESLEKDYLLVYLFNGNTSKLFESKVIAHRLIHTHAVPPRERLKYVILTSNKIIIMTALLL